jgi:ribosomal protein S19E (S16A)
MNPQDLTINQLKRAAAIKEHIEALNKELRGILGGSTQSGTPPKKARTTSAAVKRKIAASRSSYLSLPSFTIG